MKTEAGALNQLKRQVSAAVTLATTAEKAPRLTDERDNALALLATQLRAAATVVDTLRTAERDERDRGWGAYALSFDGTETPILIG